MESFIDYYDLLGIDVDASPAEIKAAFKKLALRYHPDVYKGDDAQERMRVLLSAYQTLNDQEARRLYNMRRSEHAHDGRSHLASPARPVRVHDTRTSTDVSPGARRDRQRRYAFPTFQADQPLCIDLADIIYTLSPQEAYTLVQSGMLRGFRPDLNHSTCFCHRCHHSWPEAGVQKRGGIGGVSRFCPQCQASDWSEYLLLRCIHCCAIFESEQIRYEIGHYSYGRSADTTNLCPPYELFPLCPYCGTARWCPAEDLRVQELRQQADRRATAMRMVWIGVALVVMVLVGVVAFGALR